MVDQTKLRVVKNKPRIFVTSDITNEPDDEQSLVRYLIYSNEFDTKGLVACTSTHMKKRVAPEVIANIVKAYGEVVDNLNAHVHPDNQYPSMGSLLKLVCAGPPLYGMEALEPGVPLSDGARLLIERLEESTEPLWVLCWGGANVIAQALHHLQKTRSDEDHASLRSRLRVYTISDQDDTGMWIRVKYPDIFYICSLHGWNQYRLAAWTGISGSPDGGGPDHTKFKKEWLNEHIQIGPLGQVYPDAKFLVEGDTPTFLYLIPNGLGSPEHPEWGSWGGRYLPVDLRLAGRHYSDAVDQVVGNDGHIYTSNFATVWRWRDAFQNDFAARMQWTVSKDWSKTNHAPIVIVNGSSPGPEPLMLEVEADDAITLDASESYDPDGDDLTFKWFQYKEVTTGCTPLIDPQVPNVEIEFLDREKLGRRVQLRMPSPDKCAIEFLTGKPLEKGEVLHFVLEVRDNGIPSLITYKRVVIQINNSQLRGGRNFEVPTTTDWLDMMGLL